MTRRLLSLISGLLIMFLSISSLYALEFEKYYINSYDYDNKRFITGHLKKEQPVNKYLFSIVVVVETNNSEPFCGIMVDISKKVKLKTYSVYIGNEKGNAVIKDVGKYVGTNEQGEYKIILKIQQEDFSILNNNYLIININGKYYRVSNSYFGSPVSRYEQELEYERRQKEYEEKRYKQSSEYKQKVRKPIIDNLDKNIYNIKKDAFDGRIHITSKRVSGKLDNEAMVFLRKNDVFILPRLEVNSEYYSGSFGATFNIKFRSDGKGIGYMQAVAFSNGDKSTLIRIGRYGEGETGNSFYKYDMTISQVTVPLYATEALYTIFTEAQNKPILVRIYDGLSSVYDTQISEKEKQMFIDLLKVKMALDNAE